MRQSKEVGNLHTALSNKNTPLITGLTGSQKSLYIAALASKSRTTVVITHNHAQASRIAQDIQTFTKEYPVYCFDPPELMPYEEAAFSLDLRMNRLEVLINARNPGSIVIIPVQAAMEGLISPEEFYKHKVTMDYDSRIDIEDFSEKLVVMGYERTAMVEKFGQFSVRGGIIDIYPFSEAHPVRIELFDDEVDSIRHFDINTQLTIENISEVTIYPARETIITNKDLDAIKTMIWDQAQEYSLKLHNLKKPESADKLLEKVATHLEKIDQGGFFDGIEQYKPMFSKISNILEYFSEDALIIFDEPTRLRENSINYLRDIAETITVALEQGKTLPVINKLYFDWHQIVNTRKNNPIMYFSVLGKRTQGITGNLVEYPVNSRAPEHFQGNVERFVKKVKQWRKDYNRLLFVVGTKERAERLVEYLGEEEITASLVVELTTEIKAGNCVVVVGNLETGFEFPSFKLITLTDLEIYGKQRAKHRVSRIEDGIKLSQDELKIGDYVVHINHGIGQYLGVETLEVAGVHKDYLVVKYAKEDKLYVPTDQIHLLQKYVGFDEQAPRLSRLGGSEWTRVKSRVKESVKEMAEGLLKLYAEREAIHGYAYSEDTVWQREFEDAFPYQETDDQLRAIEEVKRDMQKPCPMDRLLCGDVGYGKTEVAIRAAFKAVSEGKQVAVLVPTTILAQQHHRTFTERFENYPVNVGVLSRFQSQSKLLKFLKA